MEQKDYKLEIVNEILRNENHVREIAKRLNTNHMSIARKIKELKEENVADYKKEGKNNIYFLKDTIEARAYVFMAEKYKLLQALHKYPALRRMAEKILRDKRIRLAILFGSYAKFIAKQDSDIDVYRETQDRNIKKELSLFDTKLIIKIGKYSKGDLLIREIEKNHVIIKGVEEYYEKNNLFS